MRKGDLGVEFQHLTKYSGSEVFWILLTAAYAIWGLYISFKSWKTKPTLSTWDKWHSTFAWSLIFGVIIAASISGIRAATALILISTFLWCFVLFLYSFTREGAKKNAIWLALISIWLLVTFIGSTGNYSGSNRPKVSRAESEMRNIATALETYYIDNNCYPHSLYQLTTPVAHLPLLPFDPFALTYREKEPDEWYKYRTNNVSCWLLYSLGPDRLDDEASITYDPTNGTFSRGDVFRVGP